jgi:hypothetical protein
MAHVPHFLDDDPDAVSNDEHADTTPPAAPDVVTANAVDGDGDDGGEEDVFFDADDGGDSLLMRLPGPVLLHILARLPFMTHADMSAACSRLHKCMKSRRLRQWRLERGLAENGLVALGAPRCARVLFDEEYEVGVVSAKWLTIQTPSLFRSSFDERMLMNMERDGQTLSTFCSAVVNTKSPDLGNEEQLWVMGGLQSVHMVLQADRRVTTSMVQAYRPRINTWHVCAPLNEPRAGAFAGVVGGCLVVAGGFYYRSRTGGGTCRPLITAEVYNKEDARWDYIPSMPHMPNDSALSCVLDGKLYVLGGARYEWEGNQDIMQVLDFSPPRSRREEALASNGEIALDGEGLRWAVDGRFSWTCIELESVIPHPSFAVAFDGKLWLFGGRKVHGRNIVDPDATSVSIYDPSLKSWTQGPDLPVHHDDQGIVQTPLLDYGVCAKPAVHNGELYWVCVGGARVYVRRGGQWQRISGLLNEALIAGVMVYNRHHVDYSPTECHSLRFG